MLVADLFGVFGYSILLELTYHPPSAPDYTLYAKALVDLAPGKVLNATNVTFTETPIFKENSTGQTYLYSEKYVQELADVLKYKLSDDGKSTN